MTDEPFVPWRVCCGRQHPIGSLCRDGKVMCCICFSRVTTDKLVTENGFLTDECLECRLWQIEEMERRGLDPSDYYPEEPS